MRSPREPGSPLEPFATTVGILATYSSIVLVLVTLGVLTGPATFAWSGPMACMETYTGRVPVWDEARGISWVIGSRGSIDSGGDAAKRRQTMCMRALPSPAGRVEDPSDATVREGVYVLPPGKWIAAGPDQLCVSDPALDLRVATMLTSVPAPLGGLAFLLLAYRFMQRMMQDGLFSLQTVRRLRILGWLLIAGELAIGIMETLARSYFVSTQLPCVTFWPPPHAWRISMTVLLSGTGVLTLARIVRLGMTQGTHPQ